MPIIFFMKLINSSSLIFLSALTINLWAGGPGEKAALTATLPKKLTEIKLNGLRIRVGEPVQVAAQLAWAEGPNRRWVMNHPVPSMARFPSGELLISYSLVSDYNDNPRNLSGLQFSSDNGQTWSSRRDFVGEHQAMVYAPLDSATLLGIPAYLSASTEKSDRNFEGTYTRLELGGGRVILEPSGVKVVDWPWPMARPAGASYGFFNDKPVPGIFPTSRMVPFCFDGNILKVDGHWIATGYGIKKGDPQYFNAILASEDQGRTWRYFSTVADATDLPKGYQAVGMRKGAEGPNEISMIQLADGDLMAVFRVGSGKQWNLRRAYSHDFGRSWSKAEVIPAFSVEPSLIKMNNGIIALSSGRPGIRIWFSTDPRGKTWQDIDIVEIHNRWAPDATYRIGSYQGGVHHAAATGDEQWQTSSYTELIEVAPNRLLLVYDRSAKPEPENEADLTRIFVLPLEIIRD